nr:hypothetical protein [Tanacetum cinerariifolium]
MFVDMDTEVVESSNKTKEISQEGSLKRARDELEQEIAKKQRIEDENESTELKRCLEITKPVDDMDSFLMHTLKTMFEHHVEDKMYPLTNHTLHQMFNNVKLQVDEECEMAYELLRLVKKQLKEGYRAN